MHHLCFGWAWLHSSLKTSRTDVTPHLAHASLVIAHTCTVTYQTYYHPTFHQTTVFVADITVYKKQLLLHLCFFSDNLGMNFHVQLKRLATFPALHTSDYSLSISSFCLFIQHLHTEILQKLLHSFCINLRFWPLTSAGAGQIGGGCISFHRPEQGYVRNPLWRRHW